MHDKAVSIVSAVRAAETPLIPEGARSSSWRSCMQGRPLVSPLVHRNRRRFLYLSMSANEGNGTGLQCRS